MHNFQREENVEITTWLFKALYHKTCTYLGACLYRWAQWGIDGWGLYGDGDILGVPVERQALWPWTAVHL